MRFHSKSFDTTEGKFSTLFSATDLNRYREMLSYLYTCKIITIFFRSEAEALSRELNMRLYRTSVKDDLNVSVVFQHLAENYVNKVSVMPPSQLRFQFHFFCQIILDQKCFHRRRPNRICIRFSSWHIGTTGAGGRFR